MTSESPSASSGGSLTNTRYVTRDLSIDVVDADDDDVVASLDELIDAQEPTDIILHERNQKMKINRKFNEL